MVENNEINGVSALESLKMSFYKELRQGGHALNECLQLKNAGKPFTDTKHFALLTEHQRAVYVLKTCILEIDQEFVPSAVDNFETQVLQFANEKTL